MNLANLVEGIIPETDEDDERRNYGRHFRETRDVTRHHENFTPEIIALNSFQRDIVEEASADVENTPMVLYAYLNNLRKRTSETQHIIRAVTIDQALIQGLDYRKVVGEHDHIDPAHPLHHQISWTDCITHRCMEHFKWKAEKNVFPTRIPWCAILEPHNDSYCLT